jgi:hypothetical protein
MFIGIAGYAINAVETESAAQIVKTSNGPIRGHVDNGVLYVFKGVRCGAPPVGDLRFKPPMLRIVIKMSARCEGSHHPELLEKAGQSKR